MQCSYSTEALIDAVRESSTLRETLRRLGLKVAGGSSTLLKRKIVELGIDTAHFRHRRTGRPRVHTSFVCRRCERYVELGPGERERAYCSEDCLAAGRAENCKKASAEPGLRMKLRSVQLESWMRSREERLAAFVAPTAQANRLAATRKAAQSPSLRAKRSANASRQWQDQTFRDRFLAAAKENRRQRSLTETCPRKPHVPYQSPGGVIMVRSKWERDFACWLDRNGLEWKYEPMRVMVSGCPYTPDFFVKSPFGDCYVELHRVKTVRSDDKKLAKVQAAATLLNAPLVLISEDGISMIRRQLRSPFPINVRAR